MPRLMLLVQMTKCQDKIGYSEVISVDYLLTRKLSSGLSKNINIYLKHLKISYIGFQGSYVHLKPYK